MTAIQLTAARTSTAADEDAATGAPTVSVIIPNFNYAKTLRACLSAIYAQTMTAAEVIVVDDCSTDESVEIASAFPCTIVRNPRNVGPAASRNAGVAASSGSIIFFVDSDVALARDAIEQAVGILDASPEVGCVYGAYQKRPLYAGGLVKEYRTLHNHYWQTRMAGPVPTAIFALAAVRRGVLEAAGEFDESLRQAEDMEFSNRLARVTRIELTGKIAGAHDEDDQIGTVIRKLYLRARLEVLISRQRRSSGRLGAYHRISLILAALVPCSAVAAVVSPWFLLLPLAMTTAFACRESGLVRFAASERGPVFAVKILALHLLAYWALTGGAISGIVGHLRTMARSRTSLAATYLITGALLCAAPLLPFAVRGAGMVSLPAEAIWPSRVFLLGLGGCVLGAAALACLKGSAWALLASGAVQIPAATAATIYLASGLRAFADLGDRLSSFSPWAALIALAIVGCLLTVISSAGQASAGRASAGRAVPSQAVPGPGQRSPAVTILVTGALLLCWLVAPLLVTGSHVEPYGSAHPISDVYGALAYIGPGAVSPQAVAGIGLAVVLGLAATACGSAHDRSTGVLIGAAITAGVDTVARLAAVIFPPAGLTVRPLPLVAVAVATVVIAAVPAFRFLRSMVAGSCET